MSYLRELEQFYAQQDSEDAYERYWGYSNPVAADYWGMRDSLVFSEILRHFKAARSRLRVLEIGTGHGHELAKLSTLGIQDDNCVGIDVLDSRVKRARVTYPKLNFQTQDATALLFEDNSFDLIMQFTCVMHAPVRDVQVAMCREMARVLKPHGIIIWWDVAPMRLHVIWMKRLCLLLRGAVELQQAPGIIWQTLRELISLVARRSSTTQYQTAGLLPVDAQNLRQFFPDLQVEARQAGADFSIWESLWHCCRPLARLVWRTGFFSRHCFAVILKP